MPKRYGTTDNPEVIVPAAVCQATSTTGGSATSAPRFRERFPRRNSKVTNPLATVCLIFPVGIAHEREVQLDTTAESESCLVNSTNRYALEGTENGRGTEKRSLMEISPRSGGRQSGVRFKMQNRHTITNC